MTSTVFTPGSIIHSTWLNDVNTLVYKVGNIGRTGISKLGDFVNAQDYGVTFDNVTDDTSAWNSAILAVSLQGGGTVFGKAGATSFISSANGLIVPSNVVIDFQSGGLRGNGNTSTSNTLVSSGYVNGGILTINTTSTVVSRIGIHNGFLTDCKNAMVLTATLDNCYYSNLFLGNVYNGIVATFCLYSDFENIMCRTSSAGTAYSFDNNCNAITLKNLYAVGNNPSTIAVGFSFTNKAYAVKLLNCSSEFCLTGIVTGEVHGLSIDGHYFEVCSTFGINLQGSAAGRKVGVEIVNCTFYTTPHLIFGQTVNNFLWETTNDRDTTCIPGDIVLTTDTSISTGNLSTSTGVVRLNRFDQQTLSPTSAGLPSWLNLSDGIQVEMILAATRNGGFTTPNIAKAPAHNVIAPMPVSGFGGTSINAGDQVQPFLTTTYSGVTTAFSVIVQTSINYCDYDFSIFRFDITDNISTYKIQGRSYGTDVYLDAAAGKTVVASNSGGFLRLTISSFNHPSGTASVTAYVRHI